MHSSEYFRENPTDNGCGYKVCIQQQYHRLFARPQLAIRVIILCAKQSGYIATYYHGYS